MTRIKGRWLKAAGTSAVMRMLGGAGHQAYFVGGCVRNALLGVAVSDVDIATDARPDRVVELAEQAGLKAIPTGIEHGTVTVISGDIAHEVTTFRRDVETDGRRAVVAFSDTIQEDALRRDFTMNALYADMRGEISDPLGGLKDLKNRRVRFIEDADARIKEDYLRVLRFFRFHAWYGDPADGLDPTALAAIGGNLGGLETLSGERVGAEMLKLLAAPDPAPAVAAMEHSGVLAVVLPGATARYLAPLVHLEAGAEPDPVLRLAALGGSGVKERLRLSRKASKRLAELRDILANPAYGTTYGYRYGKAYGYLYGQRLALEAELLICATLGQPPEPGFRERVAEGAALVFPVQPADLMPALEGPALGDKLKQLEAAWVRSDFELSRSELLGTAK